jgi:hypothetical protein
MSKRKNRSGAPNLPPETLERARRQAALDANPVPVEAAEAEVVESVEPAAPVAPVAAAPRTSAAAAARREARAAAGTPARAGSASAAARRGRGVRPVTSSGRRDKDHSRIQAMLAHPTKFVSDLELKEQYGYVAEELRQVGVVAAGLIVALVVLAFVLPH